MRKKTVAICFAKVPFSKGGAEIHVEVLQNELKKRNFECDLVSVPFKWYPREEILKHAFVWRLLDLSESNGKKIDLVIGTKFPSYLIKHDNKVTWLIHQFRQVYDQYGSEFSDFDDNNPVDKSIKDQIYTIDNISLSESKRIFTNAKNTANRLKKFNGIDGEALYHPPKLVGRYKFGSMDDYILSVGRLETVKRVDLLIKSLKYTDSKVKCIIAGTGPAEENLKKLVEKLDLQSRIVFAGFVSDEDLINLYANCFAVYFAPFDEDYGYITLEAFLSKKPVITTIDAGGILEFVSHRECGSVCKVNPQEIGQEINFLFANKTTGQQYGLVGYERVKDISWDYVIDRLTETIR